MVTASVSAVGTIGLTVAGGYFFGPVGAAAGAVLGSFLFGASGPDIEGPRLGDTSVAASTYGNVIPVAFGVQKLAGSLIWATDIIEDKNTRKEGDGSFVYTSAMQNADFGTPQTALTFRVYQISAQVGRGFPSEDTTVSTA